MCVDTHVHRIMNRFGYIKTKSPFESEMALREKLPLKYWEKINKVLVSFGQHLCRPISPYCSKCPVYNYCNRVNVTTKRQFNINKEYVLIKHRDKNIMEKLISQIVKLRNDKKISSKINKQLKSFKTLGKRENEEWFSELCFCILTANSKAQTAFNIQQLMGKQSPSGFLTLSQEELSKTIQENKHRFHNNKSKFIIEARKYKTIKTILKNEIKKGNEPREFLVKNIKGIAYKESSHFLRNVGFQDYAILDRHILSLMEIHKLIKTRPKTLNKTNYLQSNIIRT